MSVDNSPLQADAVPAAPTAARVYQFDPEADWFTEQIPNFTQHLAELRGTACRAVEIGTHEGRATMWLLDNILTHPDSRLLTIDLKRYPRFAANLEAHPSRRQVVVGNGRSQRILRKLPTDSVDFVYVDGSHGTIAVLEDAVLSFPLLHVGGILAFDDYLWDDPRFNQNGTPKPAIDAFLTLYAGKIEVLSHGWQVWVRKVAK